MKNKIRKAEMCGQFIDMQPTRGGIPAKLRPSPLTRYELDHCGVRYVIGRVGWICGKRPRPKDWLFVHKTDTYRIERYIWCKRKIEMYPDLVSSCDKMHFQSCVEDYGFTFARKYSKIVKEILKWTWNP